jgi:hypothetical protein
MELSFVDKTEPGNSLSELHMRNGVPQTKGVWVSLAYTRAFGTLGPKFKSWYAHHHIGTLRVDRLDEQPTKIRAVLKPLRDLLSPKIY